MLLPYVLIISVSTDKADELIVLVVGLDGSRLSRGRRPSPLQTGHVLRPRAQQAWGTTVFSSEVSLSSASAALGLSDSAGVAPPVGCGLRSATYQRHHP